MSMTRAQAETVLKLLIPKVKTLFYGAGNEFTMAGMTVVPSVVIEPGNFPDAVPAVVGENIGVGVTQLLLDVADDTAIRFALAHELGHGFSETVLAKIGMQGASGAVTEVIADLGSAYLLTQVGVGWQGILHAVDDWRTSQIFTAGWSGDHPPGDQRATYVHSLFSLMSAQGFNRSFEAAARLICNNLKQKN